MGCCFPKVKYLGEGSLDEEENMDEAQKMRDSHVQRLGNSEQSLTPSEQATLETKLQLQPPLVPATAPGSRGCCGVLY